MNHPELIAYFPAEMSIEDRVLLISPDHFARLKGESVHECRMFLLVEHGSLTIRKRDMTLDVLPHQFIDMLAWEPIYINKMTPDLRAWCLLPNYAFTNESLNGLKPADSESFKDRYSIPLLQLRGAETTIVVRQLEQLRDALANRDHFYRTELCRSYFRNFMLETGNIVLHNRTSVADIDKIENRQDWIIRSFLKLVWRHYKTEHNVGFYAEQLCISDKHLSRVVRATIGKTPYALIRDELLQRASYLLKNTKMPVQDIAADLHFGEMAAFCKFFKKQYGQSPTAFRSGK